MLECLNRVCWAILEHVTFLTLTYPPECWKGWEIAELHRRAFLERLGRYCRKMGVYDASGFWKKEPHTKRPHVLHFHLLLFNLPFIPHDELRRMWSEVIGATERLARVEVQDVGGSDAAARYVGKYCAKGPEASYLVSGTNLHGGRWWGKWNKKHIPWAEVQEVRLPRGRWVYRIKRVLRKMVEAQQRRADRRYAGARRKTAWYSRCLGFRVFTDNVEAFWRLVVAYFEEDVGIPKAWYGDWGLDLPQDNLVHAV